MARNSVMTVTVEIELTKTPKKEHLEIMREIAQSLTVDRKSISVTKSTENPKVVVAEFLVKKAPEYKVVDEIGDEFGDSIEDYNDIEIYFSDDKTDEEKSKPKKKTTKITDEIKKQAAKIVDKFNKTTLKDTEVSYVPRYKGNYLYLDRNEYGKIGKVCRLEYFGDIKNWGFAIFKYSDGIYDDDEAEFVPGAEHFDGTILGAMKAGMEAYPV